MRKNSTGNRVMVMALSGMMMAGGIAACNLPVQAASYNYGRALSESIMFYEFQKSGKLPSTQRNNWRGDSGLKDGADHNVDLTGGWYDAGDMVKFNLPMSYSAAMLAWSYIDGKSYYRKSGQDKYILDEIKWVNDYLMKCHTGDNEFYYQVGSGSLDHASWTAAEVMQMDRPSYKITMDNPGSAVTAEAAASLASCALAYKDTDSAYAAKCLAHAKSLVTFSEKMKSDAGYQKQAGGYYTSSSFYDDISWANMWIYLATGDKSYLKAAENYSSGWGTENQSSDISYKWTQCWDDVHYGAELLMAENDSSAAGKKYKTAIENNLDYWTTGKDGAKVKYTPKGLAWLDQWGSLRYAAAEAFLASEYADWNSADQDLAKTCEKFAKSQADYILGSSGRSYLIGYDSTSPTQPHHRTAHGGWENNCAGAPEKSRHLLVGAMVGGPGSNDDYSDVRTDYVSNEVADDYNAGCVALMGKMYQDYGGTIDSNLNADETVGEELYLEDGINAQDKTNASSFIEVKAVVYNHTAWPARVTDKLSYRYFVDISDALKAGYKASDFKVTSNYTQDNEKVTGLKAWDAAKGIYYVNVDLSGAKIYPGGQSACRSEAQFRIAAPGKWDYTKSPSFTDIASSSSGNMAKAKHMALYDDGKLVYGQEPDGNASSDAASSASSASSSASSASASSAEAADSASTGNSGSGTVQAGSLTVSNTGKTDKNANTITNNFKITNQRETLDLNRLKIRYYYTADSSKAQTVWCDNADINMNAAPWYVSLTSVTDGRAVAMTESADRADHYIEVGFNTKQKLSSGACLNVATRTAAQDWSSYNQNNDFSYGNAGRVAVYYDNRLIAGVTP